MGCDIHLHVEYRLKNKEKNIESNWKAFQYADYEFSYRDYNMFAILANVRNYIEVKPIEIKGFPLDASFGVKRKYHLEVMPDDKYNDDYEWACSESQAKRWRSTRCIIEGREYIIHPDYHSPNWCTTEEMEQSINTIVGNYERGGIEWKGLLGLMKGLESDGRYECRAVFWFDN